jgi:FKBP-type peptidyl-prolyl cis-trans isomerase (trigger factor)
MLILLIICPRPLNDDFAKDVGFDTVDALKTEINNQLEKRGKQLRR